MPKIMQKSETNIIKVRRNNSIIFTIILVVLFAISVTYMTFLNNKKTDSKLSNNATIQETTIQEISPSSDTTNLEENAPQEDNDNSSVSTPHQPEQSKAPSNVYSNYLLSINLLVKNFLQDKDYTEQLYQIETMELPAKIKNILIDMHYYNKNYLLDNNLGLVRVFPKTDCWIKQFIKIEEKSSSLKDKEKLKLKIIGNLDYFINFFYSEELQQENYNKNS
ncbi:hypothetical protein [Rickettsia endosymbiont of Culicoides newsteadi]|uniref:hypothetical protein n=1 Tax=Rickettsia endosymbiont of Culicoides newsteadi TaxID=1961830 RepID=UPI00178CF4CC|nr:hypothetical protein [Rickettsia endosymbiont of Culicoides newsteadi]